MDIFSTDLNMDLRVVNIYGSNVYREPFFTNSNNKSFINYGRRPKNSILEIKKVGVLRKIPILFHIVSKTFINPRGFWILNQ